MSKPSAATWDLGRFLQTLNYFGEVPFLGSIRWWQTWLGQAPPTPDLSQWGATVPTVGLLAPPSAQTVFQAAIATPQRPVMPLSSAAIAAGELPPLTTVVLFFPEAPAPDLLTAWRQLCPRLTQATPHEHRVFDFQRSQLDPQLLWGALDDVVMGGVSQSGITLLDEFARFAGVVSTANSGGFASVRTLNLEPPLDLGDWAGVTLRVRGDGNRYKFILRNSTGWDSPAYCTSFDTVAAQWQTIPIPFAALTPTFRAKTMPTAPPFDPTQICSWQLMLSKFEYDRQLNPHFTPGPFQLDIAAISTFASTPDSTSLPTLILIGPAQSADWAEAVAIAEASGLPLTVGQYTSPLDLARPSSAIAAHPLARLDTAGGDRPSDQPLSLAAIATWVADSLAQPQPDHRYWLLAPQTDSPT